MDLLRTAAKEDVWFITANARRAKEGVDLSMSTAVACSDTVSEKLPGRFLISVGARAPNHGRHCGLALPVVRARATGGHLDLMNVGLSLSPLLAAGFLFKFDVPPNVPPPVIGH